MKIPVRVIYVGLRISGLVLVVGVFFFSVRSVRSVPLYEHITVCLVFTN